MVRDYSKTNLGIWQDEDWRALPFPAQHVYKMFWEHPQLSYCGVVRWWPAVMTGWTTGLSKDVMAQLTDCLRARHFLVVDEETEECLVRSWVRWDGVMRQPRLAVSFANAVSALASSTIRGVVIHEMKRLRDREPGALGWEKQRVLDLFDLPSIDPRDLTVPNDPFAQGFVFTLGSVSSEVSDEFGPKVGIGLGSVSDAPTTATATTPLNSTAQNRLTEPVASSGSADAERDFDEFWKVYPRKVGKDAAKKAYRSALKKPGVTAEAIVAGLKAQLPGPLAADPQFIPHPSTWLNRGSWADEIPTPTSRPKYGPLKAQDYEPAPSGMTLEESIAWQDAQLEKRRLPASGQ